jgi:uncharacterized protein YaiI (UPF0178 family)
LEIFDNLQDDAAAIEVGFSRTMRTMRVWVDADACPRVIRETLYRASQRTGVAVVLAANQPITTPALSTVTALQVSQGYDIADNEIIKRLAPGDLVITADIPLAAEVIDRGGNVLSPRGERFTRENVRQRLNMRDFLDTMRASGVHTGGPPALSQRDRQAFANQLDTFLTAAMRSG